MPEGALRDIRVVDLSQGIAGPYCTKLLADYGAEVIKVEPPEGDISRRYGPFPDDVPDDDKSGLFLHLNTNKKSITLDITTATGTIILKRLLAKAQVLVESYPPGYLSSQGLGFDHLRQEFPSLVAVSITPFGQSGPYRDYKANSIAAMALSGLMYVTGNPDREPLTTGGEPAEYFAGLCAWVSTLAALEYVAQGGQGQHIDISLWESLSAADEYNTLMYSLWGAIRRRYYSRHPFLYPADIYPCKDGYVVVVPAAAGFPMGMAIMIEKPEMAANPLFISNWDRILQWQQMDQVIGPWLQEHGWREILERAQELRMPFAAVPTTADLLENDHLQARGFFVEVAHPAAGRLRQAGAPFKMSKTPMTPGPAPLLGEHTAQLLTDELGYQGKDLVILKERGVI